MSENNKKSKLFDNENDLKPFKLNNKPSNYYNIETVNNFGLLESYNNKLLFENKKSNKKKKKSSNIAKFKNKKQRKSSFSCNKKRNNWENFFYKNKLSNSFSNSNKDSNSFNSNSNKILSQDSEENNQKCKLNKKEFSENTKNENFKINKFSKHCLQVVNNTTRYNTTLDENNYNNNYLDLNSKEDFVTDNSYFLDSYNNNTTTTKAMYEINNLKYLNCCKREKNYKISYPINIFYCKDERRTYIESNVYNNIIKTNQYDKSSKFDVSNNNNKNSNSNSNMSGNNKNSNSSNNIAIAETREVSEETNNQNNNSKTNNKQEESKNKNSNSSKKYYNDSNSLNNNNSRNSNSNSNENNDNNKELINNEKVFFTELPFSNCIYINEEFSTKYTQNNNRIKNNDNNNNKNKSNINYSFYKKNILNFIDDIEETQTNLNNKKQTKNYKNMEDKLLKNNNSSLNVVKNNNNTDNDIDYLKIINIDQSNNTSNLNIDNSEIYNNNTSSLNTILNYNELDDERKNIISGEVSKEDSDLKKKESLTTNFNNKIYNNYNDLTKINSDPNYKFLDFLKVIKTKHYNKYIEPEYYNLIFSNIGSIILQKFLLKFDTKCIDLIFEKVNK